MLTIAPTAQDVLEALYVARVATASQLQRLVMPHRTDRAAAREYLADARAAGLVGSVRPGERREARWFLTDAGYDACESWGTVTPRNHRMTPTVAGRSIDHALALNEVAIAFADAARERDDECGPLDCQREVAHPLVSRPGHSWLHWVVADAALTYGMADGRPLARFIELDRGTEATGVLVAKLRRYAALARTKVNHPQAWQHAYLGAFPKVIVVLAPSSKRPTEERLVRRARNAAALFAATGDSLEVSFCTLADLCREGPWAPVFWRPGEDEGVDLLGTMTSPPPSTSPPISASTSTSSRPRLWARTSR